MKRLLISVLVLGTSFSAHGALNFEKPAKPPVAVAVPGPAAVSVPAAAPAPLPVAAPAQAVTPASPASPAAAATAAAEKPVEKPGAVVRKPQTPAKPAGGNDAQYKAAVGYLKQAAAAWGIDR